MDYVQLISLVLGGLALFLLGMKHMSDGLQGVAGARLRRMIASVTDNSLKACLTGTGVTCIIQSSSVTSVLVISMVNAGLMSLKQAIGVILGADIGTTITAWIVALNLVKHGLPLMGLATFPFLFAKRERVRYTALLVMGLGMIFYGLQLMSNGLVPISESDEVLKWFAAFRPDSFLGVMKCVLVGSVVTAIVQSSSATVGITITLALAGIIDLETSAALVLGQNIGTTMTAALASLGATRAGRRTAAAHILTKILGVCIILPFFFPYMGLVKFVAAHLAMTGIASQIALSHTLFNIILVAIFLPFIGLLARVLTRLFKDTPETQQRLCHFDTRLVGSPILALRQSAAEILRMRDICQTMMATLRQNWLAAERDDAKEQSVFLDEATLDTMQTEIVTFIGNILTAKMPQKQMLDARIQLRIADEYESVGDYIAGLQKLMIRLRQQNITLSDMANQHILDLHDRVDAYLKALGDALEQDNRSAVRNLCIRSEQITALFKDYRKQSMDRLASGTVSPVSCVYVMDTLHAYRKINDHGLNIAEALGSDL